MKRPESNREVYEGHHEQAILDALNVLGLPRRCVNQHCEGCEYEREEACGYLYGALGIELDLRNPEPAYDAMMKLFLGEDETPAP